MLSILVKIKDKKGCCFFFYIYNFWRTWVLFVGLLIPLFGTSFDVSSGFKKPGAGSLICTSVATLLTSWHPAWQLSYFIHILVHTYPEWAALFSFGGDINVACSQRFTSGVTPGYRFASSMAAKPFHPHTCVQALVGLEPGSNMPLSLSMRQDKVGLSPLMFAFAFAFSQCEQSLGTNYRLGMVNLNTVNSKFHLIRIFYEVSVKYFLSFHV